MTVWGQQSCIQEFSYCKGWCLMCGSNCHLQVESKWNFISRAWINFICNFFNVADLPAILILAFLTSFNYTRTDMLDENIMKSSNSHSLFSWTHVKACLLCPLEKVIFLLSKGGAFACSLIQLALHWVHAFVTCLFRKRRKLLAGRLWGVGGNNS